MRAYQIINGLEKWINPSLIDSWDNTGFQIGDKNKKVKKILLSLDLDYKSLDYALDNNIDMIINHHPIIFNPLKNITNTDYIGKIVQECIKHDIIVYNAHTNLDLIDGGVNDVLADLLGLKNKEPIEINHIIDNKEYGYGRVGVIDPIDVKSFFNKIKEVLEVDYIKVYGEIEGLNIKKVAVLGGSGASFISKAKEKDADIFITSDIKYHDAQLSEQLGIVIVDAGHFNTEKVVLPSIKEYILNNVDNSLRIDVLYESGLKEIIY